MQLIKSYVSTHREFFYKIFRLFKKLIDTKLTESVSDKYYKLRIVNRVKHYSALRKIYNEAHP